jgi:ferric-dicitrate binding protein FerR (iron transport regulator)
MRRQLVIFGIVVAAVFGIGYAVFLSMTPDEPEPPPPAPVPIPPPPAPAETVQTVEVVSTQGLVERRSSGEEEWRPVAAGDRLEKDESVKTAKKASAKLRVDDKSEIDLKSRSELSVREISDTVHRFKLVRGKIGVDYDASGARVLKIESAKSEAVAEAQDGTFEIQNTGGVVSVATTTGEVKLIAKQKTVTITAGKISRVAPDAEPEEVQPIPLSVMLKVARPKKRVQRERFTVVKGTTDVGARVTVNEVPAKVDNRGRFRVRIPLKEGRNPLVVVSEDVAGNVKTRELGVIIVDSDAPIEHMDIKWGKKDRPG